MLRAAPITDEDQEMRVLERALHSEIKCEVLTDQLRGIPPLLLSRGPSCLGPYSGIFQKGLSRWVSLGQGARPTRSVQTDCVFKG